MRIPSEIKVLRSAVAGLRTELATLTPAEWETPGACGVWNIAEVVAHLAWVADLYVGLIRRTLVAETPDTDETAPALPYAERAAYIAKSAQEYRRELGDGLLSAFGTKAEVLLSLFESLRPADWQRTVAHPAGARPVRGLLTLAVLEVSVHGWDALYTAGRHETLLPDGCHEPIIEWLPGRMQGAFVARERLPEPVRYLFVLTPPLLRTIHLVIYGDRFEVDPQFDESGSDVVITLHPQTYILALMGRISWQTALDADALGMTGHTPDRHLRGLVTDLSAWFPPG